MENDEEIKHIDLGDSIDVAYNESNYIPRSKKICGVKRCTKTATHGMNVIVYPKTGEKIYHEYFLCGLHQLQLYEDPLDFIEMQSDYYYNDTDTYH